MTKLLRILNQTPQESVRTRPENTINQTKKRIILLFSLSVMFSAVAVQAAQEFWIDWGTPAGGAGTMASPWVVGSQVDFDNLVNGLGNDSVIHLGRATFQTKGITVKPGWKIRGAGMGATVVQLQDLGTPAPTPGPIVFVNASQRCDGLEISDLTVDCNLNAQSQPLMKSGAIWAGGNDVKISRVKAINFGSRNGGGENFVLALRNSFAWGRTTNNVIEDSIVVQPATTSQGSALSAINILGEIATTEPGDGWIWGAQIKGCFFAGVNADLGATPGHFQSVQGFSTGAGTVGAWIHHNLTMDLGGIGATVIYDEHGSTIDAVIENNCAINVPTFLFVDTGNDPTSRRENYVVRNNFIALRGDSGFVRSGIHFDGGTVQSTKNLMVTGNTMVMNPGSPAPATWGLRTWHVNGLTFDNNTIDTGGGENTLIDTATTTIASAKDNRDTAGRTLNQTFGDDQMTAFTATSSGWYRLAQVPNISSGKVRLTSGSSLGQIDLEFDYTVKRGTLEPELLGSINIQRHFIPVQGNLDVSKIRIGYDGDATVYLDVYVIAPGSLPFTVHIEGANAQTFLSTPSPVLAGSPYPPPVVSKELVVEPSGGDQTTTFTASSPGGWYRLVQGQNLSSGTIRLASESSYGQIDLEFDYTVHGYGWNPLGSITVRRHFIPSQGNLDVSSIRIGSDNSSIVYVDVYVVAPGSLPFTVHIDGDITERIHITPGPVLQGGPFPPPVVSQELPVIGNEFRTTAAIYAGTPQKQVTGLDGIVLPGAGGLGIDNSPAPAGQFPFTTGNGAFNMAPSTSYGRGIVNSADAGAARITLQLPSDTTLNRLMIADGSAWKSVIVAGDASLTYGSPYGAFTLTTLEGSLNKVSGGDMVASGGNIGIGRTPGINNKLDVNGAVNVSGTVTATSFSGYGTQLASLNADQLTSGIVPDARLASSVARLNIAQTFTGIQTFNPASGAPFAVGNSTKVTSLNADLLDGLDSSAFALAAHTHAAADISSGVIATARLASSGTANSTTFLRGDQTWSAGMNTVRKSTADQTINGTAYQDISGLSFPVVANTDYAFEFTIVFTSTAATGFGFSVSGPAGPVYIDYVVTYQTTANATAGTDVMTQRHDTAYDAMAATTSTVTGAVNLHANIKGTLRTGSTPATGTLSARVRSESANNDLVIKRGSWGTWF